MKKKRINDKDKQDLMPVINTSAMDILFNDIKTLIESSRTRVALSVNSEMVILYWQIGERIRKDILGQERAEYGKKVIDKLSVKLIHEYGRGFSRPNLFHMVRFSEVFPDNQIVYTLCRQLSWSHFRHLIYIEDPLSLDFYTQMCQIERWSVRILARKIQGMLYERTAISRKPEELIKQELDALKETEQMSPDLIFRDPYMLDFLGLTDTYSEKDLESAILREIENFLMELGKDFAFIARQKRITIDNEDYYIDLLFYNRRLHRLIAIDLKLGRFKASDKGQMELYLRWLDKYERQIGEESPLGLILCAGKSVEHIELLQLEQSGIRVAEYLTELLPREVLQKKLYEAIHMARERLSIDKKNNGDSKND